MNNLYDKKYSDLNLPNNNNPNLFKVGITGTYMIGHSIIDAICRSFDLENWEEVSSFSECVLAEGKEILNYRFKRLFLEAVDEFNIPLKIEIRSKEKLDDFDKILSLDELVDEINLELILSFGNNRSNIQRDLSDLLIMTLEYKNNIFIPI